MSTTHPNDIYETGRNHLKPLATALAIFAGAVLVSIMIIGLP